MFMSIDMLIVYLMVDLKTDKYKFKDNVELHFTMVHATEQPQTYTYICL